MKSMFRQLVTLSLSLAMCFLMIPGASAASYQIGDVTIETGMSDPHQIQPRAVVYYEKVSDATFFPFSIGCKPQNGHVMVLTIENTGEKKIYVDIYMDDQFIDEASYVVPAGDSIDTTFTAQDGILDNSFTFHLSTQSTKGMSCVITAIQY